MDVGKNAKAVYFGRWQPLHAGHKEIISNSLDDGEDVLVYCRLTGINEKNPLSYEERYKLFEEAFPNEMESGQLEVQPCPDIKSINIGRQVGYDIIQHTVDEETGKISGTSIRAQWADKGGKIEKS